MVLTRYPISTAMLLLIQVPFPTFLPSSKMEAIMLKSLTIPLVALSLAFSTPVQAQSRDSQDDLGIVLFGLITGIIASKALEDNDKPERQVETQRPQLRPDGYRDNQGRRDFDRNDRYRWDDNGRDQRRDQRRIDPDRHIPVTCERDVVSTLGNVRAYNPPCLRYYKIDTPPQACVMRLPTQRGPQEAYDIACTLENGFTRDWRH